MTRPRAAGVHSHLGTEFGDALEAMVRGTPGAFAGIVSDDEGYPIDYAHDAERIDDVEVQLLGAQLGIPLRQLNRTAVGQGLFEPFVLIETRTHSLLAGPIDGAFVIVMLLDRRANLGVALNAFEVGRDTLRPLLA